VDGDETFGYAGRSVSSAIMLVVLRAWLSGREQEKCHEAQCSITKKWGIGHANMQDVPTALADATG